MKMYEELAQCQLSDNRKLILSRISGEDNFTLAQQLTVFESEKPLNMFMKGAIHIDSYDALLSLRDTLTKAIDKIDSERNIEWD